MTMPTDLPARRAAPSDAEPANALVVVVAVLLMLVVSAVMLMYPDGIALTDAATHHQAV